MTLRLDPRYPVLWRTPHSLQFGADRPPVTLPRVSTADERMISALTLGATRPGLSVIGHAAGAAEEEVVALLDALAPVLAPPSRPEPRQVVSLQGSGEAARLISACLVERGIELYHPGSGRREPKTGVDLAIVVADYTIAPEAYGYWLRRDVPHLPVVFADTSVEIGPVIEPGAGPCLYCIQRHRTDADPAWTAIVSQLWGRSSRSGSALLGSAPFGSALFGSTLVGSALVAAETAALAARLTIARLGGSLAAAATSWRLDAATGEVTATAWARHPLCSCVGISAAPAAAGPARPGTSTAGAGPSVAGRSEPRRGAA